MASPVQPTPAKSSAHAQTAARPGMAAPGHSAGQAPMIRVNASVRYGADALALANGDVQLDHGYVERLVTYLLRNPERFRDVKVHFDPATRAYKATGSVKIKGVWLPIEGRARPVCDANQLGFRFEGMRVPFGAGSTHGLSGQWLTSLVTKVAASALTDSRLDVTADPATGLVRLGANSILAQIDGMPGFLRLNERATKLGVKLSSAGDLDVTLASDAKGPSLTPSAHSSLAFAADGPALAAVLRQIFAPDYQVSSVELKPGGATIHGFTDYVPVSELVTSLRAVAKLVTRSPGDLEPSKVMGRLDLALKFSGTRLVITPSLPQATSSLKSTLEHAGLAVKVEPDGIHVDLASYLASKGIQVKDAGMATNALAGRLDMDIDSRVQNPALRRPSAQAR